MPSAPESHSISEIQGLNETLCFYFDISQEPQRLPGRYFDHRLVSWTQCRSTVSSQDTINNAQFPVKYVNHCLQQILSPRSSHRSSQITSIYNLFTSFSELTFVGTMQRGSGSSSSSRHTSRSNSSSSEKDYALSVNIYGRGDASENDPPAHWGAILHKREEKDGDLYHVRKDDDFFYDDPAPRRPIESTTSHGRSEIKLLSNRRKETAAQVLNAYGKDKSNLPRGDANCQDWTVGALGALERERLAPQGTRDYWSANVGKPSPAIGNRLQKDGRSWVPKATVDSSGQAPADATFGKEKVQRPVGRLNLDKFASLSGGTKSRR